MPLPASSITVEVLTGPDETEPVRAEWDELAVSQGSPYCAPAWQLAWWRHASPHDSQMRVVVVRGAEGLLGIAPFCASRGLGGLVVYRLLAADISPRVEPLARAGAEREVAEAIAAKLSEGVPRPAVVRLEQVEADRPWPTLLAQCWPGRRPPRLLTEPSETAPTVLLGEPDYESWLAGRSRNFRQQARKRRRLLDSSAGVRAMLEPTAPEEAIGELTRLHLARRGDRPSAAFRPGVREMLAEAGAELAPAGRFRLATLTVDGAVISSHLFVCAGGEVAYWNGGFDDAYAELTPGLEAILGAVEDAFGRGDDRVDLGTGDHPYKLRLADGSDQLRSVAVVPRGPGYALARLRMLPGAARVSLSRKVPERVLALGRRLRLRPS